MDAIYAISGTALLDYLRRRFLVIDVKFMPLTGADGAASAMREIEIDRSVQQLMINSKQWSRQTRQNYLA